MKCLKCNKTFKERQFINGKIRNLSHRRFCLDCSPFGLHNTKSLHLEHQISIQALRSRIAFVKCKVCQKDYVYCKTRGNSMRFCSTCITKKARIRRKIKMIRYKGGKCIRCGYNKCIIALEFHHRDPSSKVLDISTNAYNHNWETIRQELDKCDLLCANCHREIEENKNSIKILETIALAELGQV